MRYQILKMAAMLALSGASALAGSFSSDFSNPNQTGFTLIGSGTLADGNTFLPSISGGYLCLTTNQNGLSGSFVLDDLDAGSPIEAIDVRLKLQIGPGSGNPADGLAFAFGPDVVAGATWNEEGPTLTAGFSVCFDIYDNAGTDFAPSIDIKVAGATVATTRFAKADMVTGKYEDVSIKVTRNGVLNMAYKGQVLYTNLYLPNWGPTNGLFGVSARTGGENAAQLIDDLSVTTTVAGTAAAPTVTTQPANQSVAERSSATFTVGFDGSAPLSFQWMKNNADIQDATNNVLTLTSVPFSDNNAKFKCKLTNAQGTITSQEATLTVVADTIAPTLVSAQGSEDNTHVKVTFSEPVSQSTAQNTANYTIEGLTVTAASLLTPNTMVFLTTSKQADGTDYILKVSNVKDQATAGNAVPANSQAAFKSYAFVPGFLKMEIYDNIAGITVANLTDNANYPANPSQVKFIASSFNSTPAYQADNYGARVTGFITPTVSGNYAFFLYSDDASQLWLSTDATTNNWIISAATGFPGPIAEETACCNAYTEPGTARTSELIPLVAGKRYAVMGLLKEGGGGDYIRVAWREETDTTAAGSLPDLSSKYFATYLDPSGASVTITKQPVSVQGTDGKHVSFSAAATGTSVAGASVYYQWQKNGVDIVGATGTTYTTPKLTMADNGAKFLCVASVPAQSVNSDAATLTMIADAVPPVILGAGALMNTNNLWDVGVQFDEPVDAVSAGVQANYSLSAGTISAINVYTNMAEQDGVALTVSGLTAGSKYTVTVKNVTDIKGNKIGTATKDFTASKMTWGEVGADQLALGLGAGYGVVSVAENSFDLYSDGIGEWGTYDEATFVYEKVTGNFDKMLRVEYQDLSSQWARAGLIARDVTNFGVDTTTAGRYQKVHVNPQGPTLTGPGTAGNNAWEGNRRLDTDGASTSTLVYNGRAPVYPNAWCRIVRDGQSFSIYRSDDAKAWTFLGIVNWPLASVDGSSMPATLFVGPEFSPENGNITETTVPPRGRFLAQIRDYGDSTGLTTTDVTANKRKVVLLGLAKFTPNSGGHTAATGDYALELGTAGGAMAQVTDPTFLNAPAANDELSFSLWVKRYDINDSSAFWTRSRQGAVADPTALTGESRAFQAHLPWSDNVIVFDTGGTDATCCDVALNRISASATTASGYADLGWWTNNWHHFVFTKKADQKNIYIDGKLFLNGSSSNPLSTDIGEFMIGAETGTGNSMHAKVDDFAVFGKELTLAQANSLFTGTAPSAISGAQLLAFWNFNDAPATSGVAPTLSAVKGTGGYIITFTGTLESALAITGPWTPETGTGSVTVPFTGTAKYFRAKQ